MFNVRLKLAHAEFIQFSVKTDVGCCAKTFGDKNSMNNARILKHKLRPFAKVDVAFIYCFKSDTSCLYRRNFIEVLIRNLTCHHVLPVRANINHIGEFLFVACLIKLRKLLY